MALGWTNPPNHQPALQHPSEATPPYLLRERCTGFNHGLTEISPGFFRRNVRVLAHAAGEIERAQGFQSESWVYGFHLHVELVVVERQLGFEGPLDL